MYLRAPGRATARVMTLFTSAMVFTLAPSRAAAPGQLKGEAVGVGPVTLAVVRGEPTALVLMDRDGSDAATPVGYALNAVMVELGGHRVSAVDLSGLWRPLRPVALLMVREARDEAIDRFRQDYARAGKPAPPDLAERSALLVVDWEGTWRGALAPECPGLAVVFLDEDLARTAVVCDPSPEAAAARWRELLLAWRARAPG